MDDLRIRRGLLVLALYDQYPHKLTEASLERQVGTFYAGDSRALARDLNYLEELGFIRRESETIGRRTIQAFELTASGVDLAEGTTAHAGVEIVGG